MKIFSTKNIMEKENIQSHNLDWQIKQQIEQKLCDIFWCEKNQLKNRLNWFRGNRKLTIIEENITLEKLKTIIWEFLENFEIQDKWNWEFDITFSPNTRKKTYQENTEYEAKTHEEIFWTRDILSQQFWEKYYIFLKNLAKKLECNPNEKEILEKLSNLDKQICFDSQWLWFENYDKTQKLFSYISKIFKYISKSEKNIAIEFDISKHSEFKIKIS